MTQVKNGQHVTGGRFCCRYCAGFSVSVSNKLSCNLTVACFEVTNFSYTETVGCNPKDTANLTNYN